MDIMLIQKWIRYSIHASALGGCSINAGVLLFCPNSLSAGLISDTGIHAEWQSALMFYTFVYRGVPSPSEWRRRSSGLCMTCPSQTLIHHHRLLRSFWYSCICHFLFLNHAKRVPTSGPLHVSFSPAGMFFHQIAAPPSGLCSNVPSLWGHSV